MLKTIVLCMLSAYITSALASEVPIADHPIDTTVCTDDSLSPRPVLPPYEWSCVNKKGEEERSISLSDLCRKNVAHSLVLKDPRRPTDLKNWVCQANPRGSYQMNQVLAGGWIHLGMPMPPLKYKDAKKNKEIKQQFDQAFDRVIPRRAKWLAYSEELPFGDIGLVMFWKNDDSSRARFDELLSLKNDLEREVRGKARLYVIPLETPKKEGGRIWNPGNIPTEWRELYDLRKKGAIVPMHSEEIISGFSYLARTISVSSVSDQIMVLDRHNFIRAISSGARITLAKRKAIQSGLSLAPIFLEAFSKFELDSRANARNLDDLVGEMITKGAFPKSIEDAPATIMLSQNLLSTIRLHESTTKRLGKEVSAEMALLGSTINLTDPVIGNEFSTKKYSEEDNESSFRKLFRECQDCNKNGQKTAHIGSFHTHPGENIFSHSDIYTFGQYTPIRLVGAPNDLQFLAIQTLEGAPHQRQLQWHIDAIYEAAQLFLLGRSNDTFLPVVPSKPYLGEVGLHNFARYQGWALYAGRGGILEKIVIEEGISPNEIDQFGETTESTILSNKDAARNRFLLGGLLHLATGNQKKQLSEISPELFIGKNIPEHVMTRWKSIIHGNGYNKGRFLDIWPSNFALALLVGELTYFNGNSASTDMLGSFSLLSKQKAVEDRTALFVMRYSKSKEEPIVVMAHLKPGESNIHGWKHLVDDKRPKLIFAQGNTYLGCKEQEKGHAIFTYGPVIGVGGERETISVKCQLDAEYEIRQKVSAGDASNGKTMKDCPDCPDMVIVPSGNFEMGRKGNPYVEPPHQVNIMGFAIGKTEVTRGQFADFLMATGYKREGSCFFTNSKGTKKIPLDSWYKLVVEQRESYSYPMDCVSWDDAQAYVQWLSLKAGKNYRLPTEAEWEYACRAGGKHDFCGSNIPDDVAWYGKNSDYATHQVATRSPNNFGLFDMSGNVLEWTQDCFNDNYMGAPKDGRPWLSGDCSYRPTRGGYFGSDFDEIQSSSRNDSSRRDRANMFGFRTARSLP